MRMKKKNSIPRMEPCEEVLIRDPLIHCGAWRELFGNNCGLGLQISAR